MNDIEKRYDPYVGKKLGFGQCGSLASHWFEAQTGFIFADDGNNWAPVKAGVGSGYFDTAWNVYNQLDWSKVGFEVINKPSFDQVKEGDIFFISPRTGLPTGHTGIVASTANSNITTFEQNVQNVQIVQKLPDANSWSWYGGFDGIVRKKATDNNSNQKGDEDMKIISITTDGDYYGKKYKKGACFCLTGDSIRYIERPQTLDNLKKIGVTFHTMTSIDFLYIIQDLNLKFS